MCSGEYQLLRIVQHCFFHLGRSSPEKIYDWAVLFIQGLDNGVCELFPADSSVGECLVRTDSKDCVQKEYALFCPFFQTAIVWDVAAKITVKFFIDIYQGRRDVYVFSYGEAETVCLTVIMIRVLSQDHYLHLMKWCKMKRIKQIIRRRENLSRLIFRHHCFI